MIHLIQRRVRSNRGSSRAVGLAVGSTSILKYFRSVGSWSSSTTQTLPDQEVPLSERLPAKATVRRKNFTGKIFVEGSYVASEENFTMRILKIYSCNS